MRAVSRVKLAAKALLAESSVARVSRMAAGPACITTGGCLPADVRCQVNLVLRGNSLDEIHLATTL